MHVLWLPPRPALHALLQPTTWPCPSVGPLSGAGPARACVYRGGARSAAGELCGASESGLTVWVQVRRAARDVAPLVVRDLHGDVEAVDEGDCRTRGAREPRSASGRRARAWAGLTVVVVRAATRAERELGDGGGRDALRSEPSAREKARARTTYGARLGVALQAAVAPAVGALGRSRGALAEVAVAAALRRGARSQRIPQRRGPELGGVRTQILPDFQSSGTANDTVW